MAAQYDAMGNYLGDYETEEERKKREELANTAVHTQEIKTYGDGTQEKITKEEIPGAIQPRTMMTAAGPVSPDTFGRMVQAESGGKDYTAAGTPTTSPKGAMFAAQVMPATAAQPGFGVRPAAAQTPEEYNRVGQDYYQALLKKYGGDEQKAIAAYNMGPGAVDKNIAQNQGQFNVAQAPKETQGYLDKVMKGVGNVVGAVIPSAQAGELPPGQAQRPATISPVAPGAMPQVAQAAPAPQAATPPATTDANAMFEQAGKDPFKWMQLAQDKSLPEATKLAAKQHAHELLTQEFQMSKAKEQATQAIAAAASGDPKASRAIADELKNQDGSWVKMILLGFLSPQLAGEEAVKLGFGNKWSSQTDDKGNPVLIQTNAKGLPLKGYKADGTAITENELVSYAGGKKALDIVGGTYVNDQTGEVGRVITDKNTGRSYIQTDSGVKPMSGFRPQASTGTLSDMRARQVQELNLKLQGKGVEEQMSILRPYNEKLVAAGLPPVQPSEVGINVPQIGGRAPAAAPVPNAQPAPVAPVAPSGAVTGPAVPGTPAVTGNIPAPVAPAVAGGGRRPTGPELEAAAAGKKEAAVTAGKVEGGIAGKELTNIAHAKEVHAIVQPIQQALKDATGSGLGTKVDEIAAFFGGSTKGAEAGAQLKVLGNKILMNVPRFEGPQSDRDTAAYKEAAGNLADSTLPIKQRSAALKTIIDLNKKYAPELDWEFNKPQTREKVIGGVTYIHDGKGWKAK